ncbi:hypothetical protein ABC977_06090 [Thioalkalicoccus limnaeus]|uniref:Thioredoxin domain-containing protein n=1 Tax=Thioalkalicoccus limnaeus TaxID=120681 RepID=A0ABV4BDS4_9GAMM
MSQRSPRGLPARLILALAAIGLFLIAYQWGNQYQVARQADQGFSGIRIDPPPLLSGDTTGLGEPLGFHGAWTLLAFDEPAPRSVAMQRLFEVHNRLADRPALQSALHLALVTGPAPSEQALTFDGSSASFHLVTTDLHLPDLERIIGSEEAPGPGQTPPLFLIDPSGHLVALFPGIQDAATITADVSGLLLAEQR